MSQPLRRLDDRELTRGDTLRVISVAEDGALLVHAEEPPGIGDRFVKIEGLNALLLIWWSVATLAANSLLTNPVYAVLAQNGGELWAWAALGMGIIELVAVLTDWFVLRLVAAFIAAGLFGVLAAAIGLSRDWFQPGVAIFGTLAIMALLSFGKRTLSNERR